MKLALDHDQWNFRLVYPKKEKEADSIAAMIM